MVMCVKDAKASAPEAESRGGRRDAYGEGGPVFCPPRKLSPVARALLAAPAQHVDRVTAYDETWHQGRPQEA